MAARNIVGLIPRVHVTQPPSLLYAQPLSLPSSPVHLLVILLLLLLLLFRLFVLLLTLPAAHILGEMLQKGEAVQDEEGRISILKDGQ